jgi:hypothetical protein
MIYITYNTYFIFAISKKYSRYDKSFQHRLETARVKSQPSKKENDI